MNKEVMVRLDDPATATKFISIFSAAHKQHTGTEHLMFQKEKFDFLSELNEKNIGDDVTSISITGVFLDVVSNGLSFSKQSKHVYLTTRSVKTGKKDQGGKDIYEKRLVYSTTPDGKIYLAQKSGAIDYVTKPVIVYECDTFAVETNENGNQIISHKATIPRTSKKIIAGYVYVVFRGGKREPFWMDVSDIDRLKKYSARNNRKWVNGAWQDGDPNALYGSDNGQIDTGFFGAKLISFALKNVRKNVISSVNEVEDAEVYEEPATIAADRQIQDQPSTQPELTSGEPEDIQAF